jgi:outer membrane protein OmpA-like peptidoglycan-associated protein
VRKFLFILGVIFPFIKLNAQNLINNPSFESAITDTSIIFDFDNNFTCDYWTSPSKGSPDYYTSKRQGAYGAPINRMGCQEPHSGIAYASFICQKPVFEYVQVKLNQKLVKNQYYCLSLFISPNNKGYYTSNEIDFALSNSEIHQNTEKCMNNVPYKKIIAINGDFKINGWNQISSTYTAKGGEEFLILGLFNYTHKLKLSRNIKFEGFDYLCYYIDDVSLTPIKDTNECKCNTITFTQNKFTDCNIDDNKAFTIDNLLFETNQSKLNEKSLTELLKLTDYLKAHPTYTIEIIGCADSIGKASNNLTLSKKRAESVAEFLISNGISKDKIFSKGIGSLNPKKRNDTEENRLQNRRVDIIIKKKKEKKVVFNSLPNTDSTHTYFSEHKYLEVIKYLTKKVTYNKTPSSKVYDYYNLACAYSITKNYKKCLENIKKVVTLDSSFSSFIEDPDFYNIHNTKEWKEFLISYKKLKGFNLNDSLFLDLSKIAIQDQAFYKDIDFLSRKKGSKSKDVTNIWHKKDSLNTKNLLVIEKYIDVKINVLSNKVSGELFANKCFLVIQHSSSIKKQEFYLPVIKELYLKKETSGENYALLYDRISLEKQKGKQYFGTQINPLTHKPYPIIDEGMVDARRETLGMISLKEYLSYIKSSKSSR